MIGLSTSAHQAQTQTMTLAPQMRTGIELLAMNLPELRLRLDREMSENPCIEDVEQSLVGDTVSGKLQEAEERTDGDAEGYPEDDFEPEYGTASAITADEEANERRQRFFDSQTKEETLEEHLLAQLEMADVPPEDMPVAELIIGELDDNGFFVGSIPDLVMVTGEDEAKIQSVRERIMQLDPPGCAARNAKECLLAQMDKLDGSPFQDDVRELVENHLEDVGNGRIAAVERAKFENNEGAGVQAYYNAVVYDADVNKNAAKASGRVPRRGAGGGGRSGSALRRADLSLRTAPRFRGPSLRRQPGGRSPPPHRGGIVGL